MTKLKADHVRLYKEAAKLWKQGSLLQQKFVLADREINNLRNAWAGDDELHLFVRWQDLKQESSSLQKTRRGLTAYAEHLAFAAGCYREAQTDAVNAAVKLVQ